MTTDIAIQAIDDNGNSIFSYSVPFVMGISVKQVMETAFVFNQLPPPDTDPFLYTAEYYGYSEDPQFPGYLGYEIEGIGNKTIGILPTNNQYYWNLSINNQDSKTGAETAYPVPGSTVLWKYVAIPANPQDLTARTRVIHSRRAARATAGRVSTRVPWTSLPRGRHRPLCSRARSAYSVSLRSLEINARKR
jgi:hypothetical protein